MEAVFEVVMWVVIVVGHFVAGAVAFRIKKLDPIFAPSPKHLPGYLLLGYVGLILTVLFALFMFIGFFLETFFKVLKKIAGIS